jgi:hypothetical protein
MADGPETAFELVIRLLFLALVLLGIVLFVKRSFVPRRRHQPPGFEVKITGSDSRATKD